MPALTLTVCAACAVLGAGTGWLLSRPVRGFAPRAGLPPLVGGLTSVLFAALGLRFGPAPGLPAFLYLAAVGVALALIDIEVQRLPDVLTLPSYPAGALLLGAAALAQREAGDLLRALLGMSLLGVCYLALAIVNPAGLGFGDVKLAGLIGLYLGWLGWDVLVTGAFLGFALGGLAGLGLMALRRATRTSGIPFGPFMLAGAFVVILGWPSSGG